jgi:hypothetical protein
MSRIRRRHSRLPSNAAVRVVDFARRHPRHEGVITLAG